MRPDPGRVLQGVAVNLLTNVMQEIRTPFGLQTVGIAGSLAMMTAEEFDRAADRLVTENRIVRAILTDGLPLVDGDAAAAVSAAIATPAAPNFRVSSLLAENDALRAGLVALHAGVDNAATPEARAMDERIWAELIESTRRREFTSRLI
ncbi:MAG: hypothetical protein KJ048_05055 [Dehalococcoidia bacterium]|nr:hypothetical protein [Dehalococcoidia bacterium]